LATQPLDPRKAKKESEEAVKEEAGLKAQRNAGSLSIHPTSVTVPESDPECVPRLWLFQIISCIFAQPGQVI
jgi:hypothetical protein